MVDDDRWKDLLAGAARLRREGRVEPAIAAYEALLAIKPDLADSWFNLGWLRKQSREYEGALAAYERAIALGIAGPAEAHLNRASIFSDNLHRPAEARAELQSALALDPLYVPALLNLGNLEEDEGKREDARAAYGKALKCDPGNALALARLAGVSHDQKLDRSLAERLEAALAAPGTDSAAQADLGFALGGLLDSAGEYDQAFAAYAAANRASRAAGGRAATYDRAKVEAMIERLIAATTDVPATASGAAESPLFICGLFRSGSTLVERIIEASGRVVAAGELDLIPALARSIADYPVAVPSAGPAQVSQWREDYLATLPSRPSPDHIVTDKRPDNFLHLGLIKTLFPAARIIHTTRDPLDNILSLYFLHLDPGMAYALDLEDAAHWHRQYRRLMAHWHSLYGEDILTVDYDALVRDPKAETKRLFDFCGLDWDPSVLDFQSRAGSVRTASVWQVREPLYTRSSGRWRNYQAHLESIREILESDPDPAA